MKHESKTNRSALKAVGVTGEAAPAEPEGTDPVPADRHDLRILHSLRRIMRSVDSHSRRLALHYDVTGPQLLCLLVLHDLGAQQISVLAGRMHVSPSTLVGILDRLEEKGLARRERSVRDRRQVHVSLTQKGEQAVARAPSPLQDHLARALELLPELEQVAIALSLERIADLMEASGVSEPDDLAALGPTDTIT